MRKIFLRLGTVSAAFSVLLGAFGAHSLEQVLAPEQLHVFETGVRYQFYHTFALLLIGLLLYRRKNRTMLYAGWLFVAGIVLFSGSLYLLAVREALHLGLRGLGILTPLGGLCFIAGWLLLLFSTYQNNELYRSKTDA